MKSEKIAAVWMIFVGLSIALLWIILFSTNSVNESHISFVFHLAAEGITAFFGIFVGFTLLLNKKNVGPSLFLSLGLIIASSAGAGGFYLAEMGDIMFFAILEAIALISFLLFLILYFSGSMTLSEISIGTKQFDSEFSKLINFALGLAIYTILNGSTSFGEDGNWIMVAVHVVSTILLLYIHMISLGGKKTRITQNSNQQQ